MPRPLPTATRHAIFASMIPLFMTSFIQLKYLNRGLINPCDTHPITIYASMSTLLLYFISSIVEAKLNHSVDNIYVLVCGHICDLSAALLVTLLASIVFPIPLRWFTYIALVVLVFLCLLRGLERRLYEKTRKAVQHALECLCAP